MFAKAIEVEIVEHYSLLVLAREVPPHGCDVADGVVAVVVVVSLRTTTVENERGGQAQDILATSHSLGNTRKIARREQFLLNLRGSRRIVLVG